MRQITLISTTGITAPFTIEVCDIFQTNCIVLGTFLAGTTIPPSITLGLPSILDAVPVVIIKITDANCETIEQYSCNVFECDISYEVNSGITVWEWINCCSSEVFWSDPIAGTWTPGTSVCDYNNECFYLSSFSGNPTLTQIFPNSTDHGDCYVCTLALAQRPCISLGYELCTNSATTINIAYSVAITVPTYISLDGSCWQSSGIDNIFPPNYLDEPFIGYASCSACNYNLESWIVSSCCDPLITMGVYVYGNQNPETGDIVVINNSCWELQYDQTLVPTYEPSSVFSLTSFVDCASCQTSNILCPIEFTGCCSGGTTFDFVNTTNPSSPYYYPVGSTYFDGVQCWYSTGNIISPVGLNRLMVSSTPPGYSDCDDCNTSNGNLCQKSTYIFEECNSVPTNQVYVEVVDSLWTTGDILVVEEVCFENTGTLTVQPHQISIVTTPDFNDCITCQATNPNTVMLVSGCCSSNVYAVSTSLTPVNGTTYLIVDNITTLLLECATCIDENPTNALPTSDLRATFAVFGDCSFFFCSTGTIC
jgi:hypothetical protein